MKRLATALAGISGLLLVVALAAGSGSLAFAQGGGTATPSGPQAGAPQGFVLDTILCNTPVFDLAGGAAVPNTFVRAGQTWFVNPLPYGIQQAPGAPSGTSWYGQPLQANAAGSQSSSNLQGQAGVTSAQQGAQYGQLGIQSGQANTMPNTVNGINTQGVFGENQPGGPFMVSQAADVKQPFVGIWTQIYVGSPTPAYIPTSCVAGQQFFASMTPVDHAESAFRAVGASGITGSVSLRELPNGGTFIMISASGLNPGEAYLSLTYDNSTCALEDYETKDFIGSTYTADANGFAAMSAAVPDNLGEIYSVSVRRASDYESASALMACAVFRGGAPATTTSSQTNTQQSQAGQGGTTSTQQNQAGQTSTNQSSTGSSSSGTGTGY